MPPTGTKTHTCQNSAVGLRVSDKQGVKQLLGTYRLKLSIAYYYLAVVDLLPTRSTCVTSVF